MHISPGLVIAKASDSAPDGGFSATFRPRALAKVYLSFQQFVPSGIFFTVSSHNGA
jgi:hypothetical protein